MLKLKIGQKLLLLLLVFSLLPLAIVNFYWFQKTHSSLEKQAINQQKLVTSNATFRVNQYITDKLNALIIHSQTPSVQSLTSSAQADLRSLIQQDGDITTLMLASSSGQVVAAMNRSGDLPTTTNISGDDAFRATTFLSGRQYLGPVTFTASHHPQMVIAVPLVQFSSAQNLLNLSTAGPDQTRTTQQIKGVLLETVDLSSLSRNVLAQGAVTGGYAYVVDGQGNLIAYPETSFQTTHTNLSSTPAVAAFLHNPAANPEPATLTSEKGVQVLSSYGQSSQTGWGVIVEEPTATIFAGAQHIATIGIVIFIGVGLLAILLSVFFSRTLTTPIRRLVTGARQISEGKLDFRLDTRSGDEIGTLATAFNTMTANLQAMLKRVSAESNKAGIILNNVSEGIIAVDQRGTIVLVNVAAALLVDQLPKSLLARNLSEVYHLTRGEAPLRLNFDQVAKIQDVTLTSPNKRLYYLQVLVNPVPNDPSGIAAIVTFIDQTAELELENMKVDFVSMAAHELRTPMTTIIGYLDLIMHFEDVELPPVVVGYMKRIETSSKQLVNLISNLLNASKIERNSLKLSFDRVEWPETVLSTVNDLQFSAKAKDITLSYDGPRSGVPLLGDSLSLSEVLNNLITNAINYTDHGGRVMVGIHQTPDGIETRITDTGVGIAPNKLPFLFTKFFRAREGLPTGSGGTGLGLFISKSIVEQHSGTIRVSSDEGVGSEFTIVLPKFDEKRYNELRLANPNKIRKNRGWVKKDTTR